MKGKVEKWPSFTRVELTAIWTVILAMPTETRVRIKTDSQAAINGINAAKLISKGSKWLNINNRTLISNITTLIRTKELDIQLIKVKAHTGIIGNEIADNLAKEGTNSLDPYIDVDYDSLGNNIQ